MFLTRNLVISSRNLTLKEIRRCLSRKTLTDSNGPSLKDFIKNTNQNTLSTPDQIDPAVEIENRIFIENLKRLNDQVDESFERTRPKKAVYFEIHGCQMNVSDTEVAYSILSQTGWRKQNIED